MISSKPIQIILLVLAAAIGALGVLMIVKALLAEPMQVFAICFGVVLAVSAGFLAWVGRGRVKEGQAIALICAAGAVVCGSVFAFVSTGQPPSGIVRDPATLASLAIGGLLTVIAALDILMRRPAESFPRLVKGVVIGIPLLIVVALWQSGIVARVMSHLGMSLSFAGYVLLLIVSIGLAAASGHQLIRAFQIGVDAADAKKS
jgi:hypothetical protein